MQSANQKPTEKSAEQMAQPSTEEWQKNTFSAIQLSSFLNEGAILQTGSDSYKLFIGPFVQATASDQQAELLYKPDFWDFTKNDDSNNTFLKAYKTVDLNKKILTQAFAERSLPVLIPEIEWQSVNQNAFQAQFDWLKQVIQENKISKGLPITEQIGVNFNPDNKFQILRNILQKNSEQYLYGFWNHTSGFIGFSPEILIQSEKKQFSTMALAGTWNKQNLNTANFQDSKIQNEHQIVIDDIMKQLSNEKLISKSETEILDLEYLMHLKTNFIYESENIQNCLHKLHPTAALGLYPRSSQLFSEFQKFDLQKSRKNFGAPFGYFGPEKNFVIVAIRNIYWDRDRVSIYSGCGITRGSDFETEWSELIAKRNSVKKTFGLNL